MNKQVRMNFKKVFLCFLLIVQVMNICAVISIDIDQSELERIAEILVQSYVSHSLFSPRIIWQNVLLIKIKEVVLYFAQFAGITGSLVAAGVLTEYYLRSPVAEKVKNVQLNQERTTKRPLTRTLTPASKACKWEFGCDDNVCWRECRGETTNTTSWCFSSPSAEKRSYQSCYDSFDCSPCWSCVGVCQQSTRMLMKRYIYYGIYSKFSIVYRQ